MDLSSLVDMSGNHKCDQEKVLDFGSEIPSFSLANWVSMLPILSLNQPKCCLWELLCLACSERHYDWNTKRVKAQSTGLYCVLIFDIHYLTAVLWRKHSLGIITTFCRLRKVRHREFMWFKPRSHTQKVMTWNANPDILVHRYSSHNYSRCYIFQKSRFYKSTFTDQSKANRVTTGLKSLYADTRTFSNQCFDLVHIPNVELKGQKEIEMLVEPNLELLRDSGYPNPPLWLQSRDLRGCIGKIPESRVWRLLAPWLTSEVALGKSFSRSLPVFSSLLYKLCLTHSMFSSCSQKSTTYSIKQLRISKSFVMRAPLNHVLFSSFYLLGKWGDRSARSVLLTKSRD